MYVHRRTLVAVADRFLGVGCSLITSLVITGYARQLFYPRQLWAACFILTCRLARVGWQGPAAGRWRPHSTVHPPLDCTNWKQNPDGSVITYSSVWNIQLLFFLHLFVISYFLFAYIGLIFKRDSCCESAFAIVRHCNKKNKLGLIHCINETLLERY